MNGVSMRHNSSLVCMVGSIIASLMQYLCFMGILNFKTHLFRLVGCFSMTVWTHAVLGVLCMCFCLFFFNTSHLFRAVEHVLHGNPLEIPSSLRDLVCMHFGKVCEIFTPVKLTVNDMLFFYMLLFFFSPPPFPIFVL